MDPEAVLDQVDRYSLVTSVLQRITDGIVMGRMKPGDKLVEERIAEQLGVSRSPVREALHRLEQAGLVDKIPYRGTFVSTLTDQDVDDLHVVRSPLEGLAAEILAERRDPAALAALQSTLDAMRQAAANHDQARMIELDIHFHDSLIELTGNKLLRDVWAVVSLQLRRFILLKPHRMYNTLEEAVALHEPILAAIIAGNAAAAGVDARKHVDEAGRAAGLAPRDKG